MVYWVDACGDHFHILIATVYNPQLHIRLPGNSRLGRARCHDHSHSKPYEADKCQIRSCLSCKTMLLSSRGSERHCQPKDDIDTDLDVVIRGTSAWPYHPSTLISMERTLPCRIRRSIALKTRDSSGEILLQYLLNNPVA